MIGDGGAKRHSGRAGATVLKPGEDGGKDGLPMAGRREEAVIARAEGDVSVGSHQAVGGLAEVNLEGGRAGAKVAQLDGVEGRDPGAHVVPDAGPAPIVGGIMV